MTNEQAKEYLEKIKKRYRKTQIIEAIDKGIEALELKERLPEIVHEIDDLTYWEEDHDYKMDRICVMLGVDWNGEDE